MDIWVKADGAYSIRFQLDALRSFFINVFVVVAVFASEFSFGGLFINVLLYFVLLPCQTLRVYFLLK